jgi:FkbM family methyltransferase
MKDKLKNKLSNIKHLIYINQKFPTFIRSALLIILFGKNPDKMVLNNGIKFMAPPNHPLIEMVSEIHFQKIYTPNKKFEIGIEDIVVDIGANIGIFSTFAAKRTNSKVYAFEPYKENFQYLRKNILENNLMNIVAKEIAVSGDIGNKNLVLMNNPAGHILESKNYIDKNRNFVKIPSTTIQEIFDVNKLNQIDFLKMDCEGAEGAILSSIPEKYLRKIKKMVLEFHNNVSFLHHIEIEKLFKTAGFTTRLRWNGISPFGFIYAYNY